MYRLLLSLIASLGAVSTAAAEVPKVAATIAPVHALAAGVMGGLAEPVLLIPQGQSAHSFTIRPSTARAIAAADIVFRIAPGYEVSLDRPLASLGGPHVVTLIAVPGVELLPLRGGHDDADAPASAGDPYAGSDPHIWLNPRNAAALARAIAEVLAAADPANARHYRANAERIAGEIIALDHEIAAATAPYQRRPFVVFHDGYQYFERRYGLGPATPIALAVERPPSARHIHDIRAEIRREGASCVFAEPQFTPRLVATVMDDLPTREGTFDPLGADLIPGPNLYVSMMRSLAAAFTGCLSAL